MADNGKEKNKIVREVAEKSYEYGFTTDIEERRARMATRLPPESLPLLADAQTALMGAR